MIASAAGGLAGILVRIAIIPRAISPIMATGIKSKHISIHIKSQRSLPINLHTHKEKRKRKKLWVSLIPFTA
jgi:hypothetical protein